MSTDIWMYAERRVGDRWELASPTSQSVEDAAAQTPESIMQGQSYELFAILANVRNLEDQEEQFEFISEPRDLPPDLSPQLREWADRWMQGDDPLYYDATWIMLRELLDFDWHGKKIRRRAMVLNEVAHLFHPDKPFPRDKWPPEVDLLYGRWLLDGQTVEWTETYAEGAGSEFMDEILPQLQEYGPPDDVRIVFWFDS